MSPATGEPTQREYARLADGYDARWSSYVDASVEHMLKRLPLRGGERILDVGCGTGQLLDRLDGRSVPVRSFGIDVILAMLRVARSRLATGTPLAGAEAENLPFRDTQFDWIVSTSVFHYIHHPRRALREFHRVLKPTGRLLITHWCDDYLGCKICNLFLRIFNRAHYRTYTRNQCERMLHDVPFDAVIIDRYRISPIWGPMTVRADKSCGSRS